MSENDLILIKIFKNAMIITTLKSGVNRQLPPNVNEPVST